MGQLSIEVTIYSHSFIDKYNRKYVHFPIVHNISDHYRESYSYTTLTLLEHSTIKLWLVKVTLFPPARSSPKRWSHE